MQLKDYLPREFFCEYLNTRAYTLIDIEVRAAHSLVDDGPFKRWPGKEKNVMSWWELVDGRCVGWNENPSRGWSFPVFGKKRF